MSYNPPRQPFRKDGTGALITLAFEKRKIQLQAPAKYITGAVLTPSLSDTKHSLSTGALAEHLLSTYCVLGNSPGSENHIVGNWNHGNPG